MISVHHFRKIFALTLLQSAAAFAQPPTPLPSGSVMTLDVAGVRLGMPAAAARTSLARLGYRVTSAPTTPSFEQRVRSKADSRLGKPARYPTDAGTYSLSAYGPHGEYLEVGFLQRPGMSIVGSVNVSIPADAMRNADFRAQISAKYGKPDFARFNGAEQAWCSKEGLVSCGSLYPIKGVRDDAYPKLATTSYGDGGRIVLDIGATYRDALGRDIEVAVDEVAPKSSKAAF